MFSLLIRETAKRNRSTKKIEQLLKANIASHHFQEKNKKLTKSMEQYTLARLQKKLLESNRVRWINFYPKYLNSMNKKIDAKATGWHFYDGNASQFTSICNIQLNSLPGFLFT